MASDLDIYRSAQILLKSRGEEALSYAAGRAADFAMKGDQPSALAWKRIVEAIRELQRVQRGEGEAVH